MGTNCAPLVAESFLFCYERGFMLSLSDNNQSDVDEAFNSTSRYSDDCGSVVVDSLLIVTSTVEFCDCSMFCCELLCVHSSSAIISVGKREPVALLCLSSWCLMIVVWLFLTLQWVCLQFEIVVFPDHTHLQIFLILIILILN